MKSIQPRPRRNSHGGISGRPASASSGPWPANPGISTGWFHESAKYTPYTTAAAIHVPFRRARQRSLRQGRAAAFSAGWSASAQRRVFRTNASMAMNRTPAENFESSAPARARANRRVLRGLGSRHTSPKVHSVNTVKSAMATSVSTSGPKVRNAGMLE